MSILTPIKNKLIRAAGLSTGSNGTMTMSETSEDSDDVILSSSSGGSDASGIFVKLVTESQVITLPRGHSAVVIYAVSPGHPAQTYYDYSPAPEVTPSSTQVVISIQASWLNAGVGNHTVIDVGANSTSPEADASINILGFSLSKSNGIQWDEASSGPQGGTYIYSHAAPSSVVIESGAENIAVPGAPGFILNESWDFVATTMEALFGAPNRSFPLEYMYGDPIPFLDVPADSGITETAYGYIPKNDLYDTTIFGLGGNTLGDFLKRQPAGGSSYEIHKPGAGGRFLPIIILPEHDVIDLTDYLTITVEMVYPEANDFSKMNKSEADYPEYYFGPGKGGVLIASWGLSIE